LVFAVLSHHQQHIGAVKKSVEKTSVWWSCVMMCATLEDGFIVRAVVVYSIPV